MKVILRKGRRGRNLGLAQSVIKHMLLRKLPIHRSHMMALLRPKLKRIVLSNMELARMNLPGKKETVGQGEDIDRTLCQWSKCR